MSAAVHFSCDAAAARSAKYADKLSHPRHVLATTVLASGLAFVDGSVVNVGLPAIGQSLEADAGALQWVVNAYLLPLSALLLLGGAAGDRFGRRRLLVAGTGLFALASLGCALAPNLELLLASWFLQGVAAAMLMPNSLAILGATFSGDAKGRAIGVWAATGAAMGALGPVLGGWLIDLGSWRAIFLINLPLAAAAILLAWRYIPHDVEDNDQSLDWFGALLSTGGLGLLTWALTVGSGQDGWNVGAVIAVSVAFGLLVLFVVAEDRRGDRAMMPLALFASKSFVGLTLLTLLLYGALGGLFVLIPYVLIKEAHYSATAAGAALLPLPLVLAVASPVIGGFAERIGPRLPLTIGPLVVAAGFPADSEDQRTGGLLDGGSAGDPHHSGRAERRRRAANDDRAQLGRRTPHRLSIRFQQCCRAHWWPCRDSTSRLSPRGARSSACERIPCRHDRQRRDMSGGRSECADLITGAIVAEREN